MSGRRTFLEWWVVRHCENCHTWAHADKRSGEADGAGAFVCEAEGSPSVVVRFGLAGMGRGRLMGAIIVCGIRGVIVLSLCVSARVAQTKLRCLSSARGHFVFS